MERSSIKDIETKHILKAALTDDIHSCEGYVKGIDHNYYYEGYSTFKTEDFQNPKVSTMGFQSIKLIL